MNKQVEMQSYYLRRCRLLLILMALMECLKIHQGLIRQVDSQVILRVKSNWHLVKILDCIGLTQKQYSVKQAY